MKLILRLRAMIFLTALVSHASPPVTIDDCISCSRIAGGILVHPTALTFAPSGHSAVALAFRGDLKRNMLQYQLLRFDLDQPTHAPEPVLSFDWENRSDAIFRQHHPLEGIQFLSDQEIIALLQRPGEDPQIVRIDLERHELRPILSRRGPILGFAANADGSKLLYVVEKRVDDADQILANGFSFYESSFRSLRNPSLFAFGVDRPANCIYQIYLCRDGRVDEKVYESRMVERKFVPRLYASPNSKQAFITVGPQGASGAVVAFDSKQVIPFSETDPIAWAPVVWSGDSQSCLVQRGTRIVQWWPTNSRTSEYSIAAGWSIAGWKSGHELMFHREYQKYSPENANLAYAALDLGSRSFSITQRNETGYRLSDYYYPIAFGSQFLGVVQDLDEPPEFALFDEKTKSTITLTDLNPELRTRARGAIEPLEWSGPYGKSFGWLIKPVGYQPGKRYPLIIQWRDGGYAPDDHSYLLDGPILQLSGAAVQVWANAGFVVLCTGFPLTEDTSFPGSAAQQSCDHIDQALDLLDQRGLIDPSRVGMSGWSNAGFRTLAAMVGARHHLAAVTTVDNITLNFVEYLFAAAQGRSETYQQYWNGTSPWGGQSQRWAQEAPDFQYGLNRTPLLLEYHTRGAIPIALELCAAFKAQQIPVEFCLFPDSPHNLVLPQQRSNSLNWHTDWFRFWLQDFEDANPSKQEQYARWRELKSQDLAYRKAHVK